MKKIYYIPLILIVLFGCNSADKTFMAGSGGKAGELVIVVDNKVWESNVGDTLRHTLAQAQMALPQPEPLFTLIKVPTNGFSDLFKMHRNILYIKIKPDIKNPGISMHEDKWAKNQMLIYINAPNEETFLTLFNENKYKIISSILKAERERTQLTQKMLEEYKVRETLVKEHKISLVAPKGFNIDVDSATFVWISHTEHEMDQGLLIYYYPYMDESDLEKENLINKRNEVLKRHVHGSAKGSYMATEDLVPVYYNSFYKKNGLYIAELRGLWKLEKGFMGGPFISHTTIDTVYNRVVTAEGYVFAPNRDKRNLLRQLEAILYTLEITK